MENLYIASMIPSLSEKALLVANHRIRTSETLFNHRRSHSGKLLFSYAKLVDFIQIEEPHADWLYTLIIDYFSFLCDLRCIFFNTGESLLALALRFNLDNSIKLLTEHYQL